MKQRFHLRKTQVYHERGRKNTVLKRRLVPSNEFHSTPVLVKLVTLDMIIDFQVTTAGV